MSNYRYFLEKKIGFGMNNIFEIDYRKAVKLFDFIERKRNLEQMIQNLEKVFIGANMRSIKEIDEHKIKFEIEYFPIKEAPRDE